VAGVFIALEGGEGAGKSTQSAAVAAYLTGRGHEVVMTREPGGTAAAEAIRAVLLDPANTGLDDRAEALLFAAARADHVARVIRPALDRGAVVVTDRFVDSSIAYQGIGRDLGRDRVADLSVWATGGLLPDLTVVLDIDPAIGLSRVDRPDRLEAEPLEWHRRVRQAFVDLAARAPDRYLVVAADQPVEAIAARVAARVDLLLVSR
jgi:dTMP kinase